MQFSNVSKDKADDNKVCFTKDQEYAVGQIIDFIATPFNPAKHIVGLTGAGGTGKTFVIKYIISHCKYSNSVIKCTSPTHKACRVFSQSIGGKEVDTIQRTFGLRPDLKLEDFDPKNPQFNPIAKPKLDNIKVLIIDEASMLPANLVVFINRECKVREIKIIYIGDDKQLTPVEESKSIAFKLCSNIYRLEEIVRQSASNPINILLKLLRYDIEYKTYRFLEYVSKNIGMTNYNDIGEGFSICNSTAFKDVIDRSFSNEEYTKNIDMYRIIAYTNARVSSWNNYIRNTIIQDASKNIITKNDLIMSHETIVNDFMEVIISNSEEYIINDIVDYVDDTYGFKGFLIKFQLVHGGRVTPPLFVINHKDKFTIQKYYKTVTDMINAAKTATGGTRVSRWKDYYRFKKKYLLASNIVDKSGNILYKGDIDYGFAITAHKAQGSTYDTVFVDVNNIIYDRNNVPRANQDDLLRCLYTGCSRAHKELVLYYGN